MTHSFNLVVEPWLPCTMARDGERKELGLEEVLTRSHEVREISDPSPVITIALHRLLLAILHRNFGPRDTIAWRKLWREGSGQWDADVLRDYFWEWNDQKNRFDLFDESFPFYQSASVPFVQVDPKTKKEKQKETTVAKLVHGLSSGHDPTLFDHSLDEEPRSFSPAETARLLVAFQSFAVVGLLTSEEGQDRKEYGSADNAPLVKGVVTLVKGSNLFQTLMLNFHHYSSADEEPFPFDPVADSPAWERDEDTEAIDRRLGGYVDLLTWQSRRVRLHPESDSEGETIVRFVVAMKGNQFPDKYWRHGRETMLAFTKNENAKDDQEPWPALAFREDRSLWRDSLALYQSIAEKRERPRILDWLSDLAAAGTLLRSNKYPLDLLGLCSSKAKILFWRHECLPLPLAVLDDQRIIGVLESALALTEDVARTLRQSCWLLAKGLLVPDDSKQPGKQQKQEIDRLLDSLAPARLYWSRLEVPFRQFLEDLPGDVDTAEEVQSEHRERTLEAWRKTLRRTARNAFDETTRSLDNSARVLKAVATAEKSFNWMLHQILPIEEVTANE